MLGLSLSVKSIQAELPLPEIYTLSAYSHALRVLLMSCRFQYQRTEQSLHHDEPRIVRMIIFIVQSVWFCLQEFCVAQLGTHAGTIVSR